MPTSPSPVQRLVTRDSDHTPVRQHVYPCTPGNLDRPLTQKTISTMFYVEVECTAVSVVHILQKSVITKCVCACDHRVYKKSLKKQDKRSLAKRRLCVYNAQVPVLCRIISANIRLFVKEVKITIRREQALNLQRTFRTLA